MKFRLAGIAFFVCLTCVDASASNCASVQSTEDAFDSAKWVFRGKVVSVGPPDCPKWYEFWRGDFSGYQEVRLEISQAWKGPTRQHVVFAQYICCEEPCFDSVIDFRVPGKNYVEDGHAIGKQVVLFLTVTDDPRSGDIISLCSDSSRFLFLAQQWNDKEFLRLLGRLASQGSIQEHGK